MENNDSDLNVPLSKVGETGTKVILTKTATYNPNGSKKKWRKKITLAEPIQLGQPIIKEEIKKKRKMEMACKYFATLSKVEKIKQMSNNVFCIETTRSDYKIVVIK